MAICSDGADVTSLPHELSREFLLYHGVAHSLLHQAASYASQSRAKCPSDG